MNPTIQILDLDAIKVDHSVQSRVRTSPEYMHEFSEAMLRDEEFPPIVTFFDGGVYWLADGFHRYGARKTLASTNRKFAGIKAMVREGSKTEAIIYSAGANQKFAIPRTPEDIKRAIYLLRALPAWRDVDDKVVGKHVGAPIRIVRRWTETFYAETLTGSRRKPRTIVGTVRDAAPSNLPFRKDRGTYRGGVAGQDVDFGEDRQRAVAEYQKKKEEAAGAGFPGEHEVMLMLEPLITELERCGLAGFNLFVNGKGQWRYTIRS